MKNTNVSINFFVKNVAITLLLILLTIKSVLANVVIWPTTLQMEATERTISIWLENHSNSTQVYQARVFSWDQKTGEDQLNPQNHIMISPPLIKIAPGEKQMFRVVQRTPIALDQLNAYRVVLDEVPQKINPNMLTKDEQGSQQGLGFQFRYSLPLFVYGKQISNKARESISTVDMIKQLTWKMTQSQGRNYLNITNKSNYYVHLANISSDTTGAKNSNISAYILPKSTRVIEIEDGVVIGNDIYGSIAGTQERVKL